MNDLAISAASPGSPASSRARSLATSLPIQGVLAGLAATQALDVLSTILYERESPFLRLRENLTRGNLHAYERAVGNMAKKRGIRLSHREKEIWGWRFHKAFGLMGGVTYALLRRRFPKIAGGAGLGFGIFFFLVGDELMMPLLGLTPGPKKFSWKVHGRGAAAHIAYGLAAEAAIRIVERFGRRMDTLAA